MIIDENIKAVIIGLWRQGNKTEIISTFTGVSVFRVAKIIHDYQNGLKKNSMIEMPDYPLNFN